MTLTIRIPISMAITTTFLMANANATVTAIHIVVFATGFVSGSSSSSEFSASHAAWNDFKDWFSRDQFAVTSCVSLNTTPGQSKNGLYVVNIKVDLFPDGQMISILLYLAKNVQKSMFVG